MLIHFKPSVHFLVRKLFEDPNSVLRHLSDEGLNLGTEA